MREFIFPMALVCAATFAGCASDAERMAAVKPGMTTEEVLKTLGKPVAVVATLTNNQGKEIKVFEYYFESSHSGAHYWYIFTDGKFTASRPASSDWSMMEKSLKE